MKVDNPCLLSCCSGCFGVESKLVTTESEVPRWRALTMLRPPFIIIQFVGTASNRQEVPKTQGKNWRGPSSSKNV